jgi:hypothetical protein
VTNNQGGFVVAFILPHGRDKGMMKSKRISENWRGTLAAWNYKNNIAGVINDLLEGAPDEVLEDRLKRFSFLCRAVEYFFYTAGLQGK